jgi:signal transduction histidine kinase
MYGAMVGAALYLTFFVIAWAAEAHTQAAQTMRLSIVCALTTISVCLARGVLIDTKNYVPIAAVTVACVLACIVVLPVLPSRDQQPFAIQASPAIMCGLFIMYAFLRLPLVVALALGLSAGAASIVLVPVVSGGSETARTVVYLLSMNVLGACLLRLIEVRERELFLQRQQAEAARTEARRRQELAEEADRQKTRLIAAVSHDLRQPMTAAVAHLDVLRARLQGNDLDGARGPAERAIAAISMLGSTLDHLLTAARYDSGTEALRIELVAVRPLFQDLDQVHASEAAKRGVALRFRLPRKEVLLRTDARSVHRVLSNLISNAIKFTDERRGSGVLVAARMYRDRCRIDVFDTGIGIAEEHLSEIWKPYVQLNNVDRDRERGLGLGLFLVQRIVEQLADHSVSMSSRPGRGSRFTIMLPAVAVERAANFLPPPEMAASTTLDLSPLRGAYVLLLEDDRVTRTSLTELLEEWGLLVSAAATYTELMAMEAESERIVDAIVCDHRLADGANGIDTIATLRERLGYAPHAVLITGEPDIAPLRARAGPETTVLHKPFPPVSLARPLLRAVEAARQMEEG